MHRLTQKDSSGNWCLRGIQWKDLYEGHQITRGMYEKLYAALWKLMEYEDSGLSPEDIEKLSEEIGTERCGDGKI